jgi:hypothetical protein
MNSKPINFISSKIFFWDRTSRDIAICLCLLHVNVKYCNTQMSHSIKTIHYNSFASKLRIVSSFQGGCLANPFNNASHDRRGPGKNLMFLLWFAFLGGSLVFLDEGPFILFFVFPLFWML